MSTAVAVIESVKTDVGILGCVVAQQQPSTAVSRDDPFADAAMVEWRVFCIICLVRSECQRLHPMGEPAIRSVRTARGRHGLNRQSVRIVARTFSTAIISVFILT